MFQDFLHKIPNINVTNALTDCEGILTRVRHMQYKTQDPVLYFFLVYDELLPLVTKVKIHKKVDLCITRYKEHVVKTDHKMLNLELKIKMYHKIKHNRKSELSNRFLQVHI